MALNRNIKVKLPESKCSFTTPNEKGEVYVCYLLSSKRISKDKVSHKRVNIGLLDKETNMLIPNPKYYELFDDNNLTLFTPNEIRQYGHYYLFYTIVTNNGLWEIIKKVFGKDSEKILTIAMYMVSEQEAMYYLDDYCDGNYVINNTYITSKEASNIFKRITIKKRQEFFNEWIKLRKDNECIAYDVTSISSYAKDISEVEYGYNRDKEKLPQINLGMFYGQKSNTPLFYDVYNGSIGDKVHFEAMMKYAKSFNMNNISLVMDRGFYKYDNLEYLYKQQIPFLMGISNSSTIVSKIIQEEKDRITSSRYELPYELTNGISREIEIKNLPFRLNLYYNYQKKNDELVILNEKIEKLKQELETITTLTDDSKYKKFFDITINEDNTFSYIINYDKIDKEQNELGFYAILSSRIDDKVDQVLLKYRKKDVIEKTFDNLKNFIDSSRLRVHSAEAMEGKIFVTFLSLIIKAKIDEVIANQLMKENISGKKVINQLKNIRLVRLYNGNNYIAPLTAKQKKILSAFNITEEELKKSIKQLHL